MEGLERMRGGVNKWWWHGLLAFWIARSVRVDYGAFLVRSIDPDKATGEGGRIDVRVGIEIGGVWRCVSSLSWVRGVRTDCTNKAVLLLRADAWRLREALSSSRRFRFERSGSQKFISV